MRGLEDYEPVEARIRAFWADYPSGRIVTELVHTNYTEAGRIDQVVVRAAIWRQLEDPLPAAVDYAEETVGASTVNRYSALENACTSATGRALANLGYSPKGARPSREEMAKVHRLQVIDLDTSEGIQELERLAPDAATNRARVAEAERTVQRAASGSTKPSSEKQRQLIGSLMQDYGIPTADRLAYAAEIAGRPIDSASDLSVAEASELITHLKASIANKGTK